MKKHAENTVMVMRSNHAQYRPKTQNQKGCLQDGEAGLWLRIESPSGNQSPSSEEAFISLNILGSPDFSRIQDRLIQVLDDSDGKYSSIGLVDNVEIKSKLSSETMSTPWLMLNSVSRFFSPDGKVKTVMILGEEGVV